MTGLLEDSSSPSNFIHGSEACAWKGVVDQYDLVDLYLCAAKRKGPVFTWQMVLPSRIDQSWLDQFYENNSGSWFHHVSNLWHDDRQTLSEHIPIITSIQLVQVRSEDSIRKGMYLKMDASIILGRCPFQKPNLGGMGLATTGSRSKDLLGPSIEKGTKVDGS